MTGRESVAQHPVIQRDNSLEEAIDIISKNNVSILPVLGAEGKLVGIITRASLVDVMANKYGDQKMDS